MSNPDPEPISNSKPLRTEGQRHKTFLRAECTQLAVQIRLLDGKKHSWPYAHLAYHSLDGGKLTIFFSEHMVIVLGRHLEDADQALRLQSLAYLQENGTRRKEALGEPDIPEDEPAIDSIKIYLRGS